jgi:hypothetical protein
MNQAKQNQLYANLMDEVKARINVLDSAAVGDMRYPPPFVREFCYLQLRMLCELIALSCLVAHGDITLLQPHKLGKSYSADDILERMEKLRPDFYPLPFRQSKDVRGQVMTLLHPSPLPKTELLKLYAQTHKHLHRGSLKKLISSDSSIEMTVDMPEIIRWAQKIHDLLAIHTIVISSDYLISCILRNAADNDRVQVAILTKTPPGRPAKA